MSGGYFYILGSHTCTLYIDVTRRVPRYCSDALYQGTTLVGPYRGSQ